MFFINGIKCLLVLLVVFGTTSVFARTSKLEAEYSMSLLGANIGRFSVSQTEENGTVEIKAVTDVKVKLLFSYQVKYIQHTVYKQGTLQSAHVETYKNGKLNSVVSLKLKEGKYQLITKGDTSFINSPVTYSGSLVYFNEPVGIKKIFKERTAENRQINALEAHVYNVKDEKGRELNRYFYEDGILQQAEMKHALGTIELQRVEVSRKQKKED